MSLEPPPLGAAGYAPNFPPAASLPRIASHVRTLGILWCIYGCFRLIRGLTAILLLHAFTVGNFWGGGWPLGDGFFPGLPPWLHALIPWVAALTLLGTILAFVTSYGLLTHRSWGRTLALVAAALSLIKIPLGTALGIYTLWALARSTDGAEYDLLSKRSS